MALAYTARLEAGLGAKASLCQQRHEFVTQEQAYDVGGGSEAAAVAAGQATAAAAPPADDGAAAEAGEMVQAEQAAELQLKKQRIS